MDTSPVTLNHVADAAGVSLATASRVLNGSTRKVAESYREKVLAAAARLGYAPNLSAQAVAKGHANIIGLLVGDIADPYFSSITAGAMAAAEAAGFVVTVAVTGRDAERELRTVRTLRGQSPRALILAGSRFTDAETDDALSAELQKFQATGGRVVMISQKELPFATVQIDNAGASVELGRAVAAQGYRRAAVVAGPEHLITSSDRAEGFARGFGEKGGEVVITEHDDFTREGGYAAASRITDRLSGVDVVFATSDVMAVGAMSALRDAGIEPGRDVGIAGFDDIATARDVTPALTTIAVDLPSLGQSAVELALEDGAEEPVVSGTVMVRDSTPSRA